MRRGGKSQRSWFVCVGVSQSLISEKLSRHENYESTKQQYVDAGTHTNTQFKTFDEFSNHTPSLVLAPPSESTMVFLSAYKCEVRTTNEASVLARASIFKFKKYFFKVAKYIDIQVEN